MRTRIRLLLLKTAVVGVAMAATGCDIKVGEQGVSVDLAEGRARSEWTRTYELPPGGRLEIANIDGTIDASPAGGSQVEVGVTLEVTSRSDEAARELLEQVTIKEDVTADRLRIESPDLRRLGGLLQRVRTNYRVAIPPGLRVSLQTENGAVGVTNVDGRLTAQSTNGAITARGLSGTIDASTVNGGIVVEMASIAGDVRLVTVNGGIRLDVPRETNATLEASAVNGRVLVQDGVPLAATERTRVRVSGPINAGGPTLEARTTNGAIRIGTGGSTEEPAGAAAGRPPRSRR